MLTKKFVIKCDEGFHLRPAQVFVETASQYNSEFIIKKSDTEEANANSILGLMSLGLDKGDEVTVTVSGPDEEVAMQAVEKLFDNNFGE